MGSVGDLWGIPQNKLVTIDDNNQLNGNITMAIDPNLIHLVNRLYDEYGETGLRLATDIVAKQRKMKPRIYSPAMYRAKLIEEAAHAEEILAGEYIAEAHLVGDTL